MVEDRKVSVLDELKKALEGKEARARRSHLDVWMTQNYDAFSALLDEHGPNWATLTETFETLGYGPLGPETVRQTWYRVRKRKASRVSKTTRLPNVDVLSSPAPTTRSPQTPSPSPTQTSTPPTSTDNGMADVLAEMNKRSGRT